VLLNTTSPGATAFTFSAQPVSVRPPHLPGDADDRAMSRVLLMERRDGAVEQGASVGKADSRV
jgi:hypothetical protein